MSVERFMDELAKFVIKTEGWTLGVDPTHHHEQQGNGDDLLARNAAAETYSGGLNRAATEEAISNGTAGLHDNLRNLAASDARLGYSTQEIINHLHKLLALAGNKIDPVRFAERWDYVPELARSAVQKFPPLGGAGDIRTDTTTPAPLAWLDMADWDLAPPAPIAYVVKDRIPARQVCLFTGHGASGKSTIALNLCCATVLGRDWLKSLPDFGPAIFIDAEDDEQVLHHRLYANAQHYSTTFAQLIKDGLHILPMAGKDCVMATVDRNGKVMTTAFYKQVLGAARAIRPKITVLASLANMFTGSENDRSQTQQFVSLLTEIAIVSGGAVILIAHPSVRGIETKTGISGSTAWFNSVRAQMYLRTIEDKDEEQANTDLRVLEFKKNQYGKVEETLQLTWRSGLFVPVGSANVEQLAREHRVDEAFLALMRRFTATHRPVSPQPRSATYAPDQFKPEQEASSIGATRKEIEAAMRRLLATGAIEIRQFGPPSKRQPFLHLRQPSDENPQ